MFFEAHAESVVEVSSVKVPGPRGVQPGSCLTIVAATMLRMQLNEILTDIISLTIANVLDPRCYNSSTVLYLFMKVKLVILCITLDSYPSLHSITVSLKARGSTSVFAFLDSDPVLELVAKTECNESFLIAF